jgi:hypothetical protein
MPTHEKTGALNWPPADGLLDLTGGLRAGALRRGECCFDRFAVLEVDRPPRFALLGCDRPPRFPSLLVVEAGRAPAARFRSSTVFASFFVPCGPMATLLRARSP